MLADYVSTLTSHLTCREKDSSLQDLESRYGKSIERIALLEEELVNKAQLEEEVQRLKDELRGTWSESFRLSIRLD